MPNKNDEKMSIASNRETIKSKLKVFGTRAAIVKAIEEVYELQDELEILLDIWDTEGFEDPKKVSKTVLNIAKEYADVSIAVHDTFCELWPEVFAKIVKRKREIVYNNHLPRLIEEKQFIS